MMLGFNITGTSRNQSKRKSYQKIGYQLVDFNLIEVEAILRGASHLLVLTPPNEVSKDPVLSEFLPILEKNCHQWEWIGYASSTGVYGNHDGAWVDECTQTNKNNLGYRAKQRLAAENAWLDIAKQLGLPIHIFRIAGVYGPYRNALKAIKEGKVCSIYKENHFFSRIHVVDIANVIVASIQKPKPMSIYNVADDLPAPSHEVDLYAAKLLDKPPLTLINFNEAKLTSMLNEFYTNNRRINNKKIKAELGVQLDYPSYKKGLIQLFKESAY
jgi:nucleoside-diphosphate-sugar epimerase